MIESERLVIAIIHRRGSTIDDVHCASYAPLEIEVEMPGLKFYPSNAPVPEQLQTQEFLLRPIRASDSALDYDAVMASEELLRRRTGGKWPHIGFNAQANRADLEQRIVEFRDRRGFTYTLLDPTEGRCLGCVSIEPLQDGLRRTGATAEYVNSVGPYQALVSFWVRSNVTPRDMDRYLVTELIPWMKANFAFTRIVYLSWEGDSRQISVLQGAGLNRVPNPAKVNTEAVYLE